MKNPPPHRFVSHAFVFSIVWTLHAIGAPIHLNEATSRAKTWMTGHPVMGKTERTIERVETFPGAGAAYSVYVLQLVPAGYLLLNSDDRLPLVIAFSDTSTLSLENVGENSFRAFLATYVEETAEKLAQQPTAGAQNQAMMGELLPQASDESIPPMLDTTWDQSHPYNLYAPDAPTAGQYYGYRAPTGCVPTAFSQVLNFHRWPVHGHGSHTYTDNTGSLTGSHSANFSDPYDWGNMQPTYDAFGTNPQLAMDAVAELNYELGVAVQADFEAAGTASSTSFLGKQLGKHFYYEQTSSHDTQAPYLEALANDLRKGFPSVLTIPGHAVVADGLLTTGGTTSYHINYGWGGQNNGWWAANAIPGGAADGGVSSIIPSLMSFPTQQTASGTAGHDLELQWILPKRREQEAQKLNLYKRTLQTSAWSSAAETLSRDTVAGWSLNAGGRSGNCWYAGPSGPAIMDLEESFVPSANTSLTFWRKFQIASNSFRISVSTDDGNTFTSLQSWSNLYSSSFSSQSVSLSAYAGQTIRLRFELISGGSYYPSGGIWIDDLSMNSGHWNSWTPLVQNLPLDSRRFSAVSTSIDSANNFTIFQKTSTSSYMDWGVTALDNAGTGFYKEAGGYSNREYHLTSYATITPTASTRLSLHMKYMLASDSFRVMASTNRTTFTPIATFSGIADWADVTVDLAAYAGQAIYIRLEYVVGNYYNGGGVWIDSTSTEQVTYPELEGQPVHFTVTDELPSGTYLVAATITDQNLLEHRLSPTFTLQVEASYQVVFDLGTHGTRSGGGELIQTIAHGGSAMAPTVAPNPGWLMTGWSQPFAEVTSNLTVTANYQAELAAGGTPHWWLIENGIVDAQAPDAAFTTAENTDPLGKGYTLHDEYLFGTNPADPSSRFQVHCAPSPDGKLTLEWTGRAGRVYQILRSGNLAPPWQPVSVLPCTQDNLPMSYEAAATPTGSAFYRIAVSLAE